MYRCPDVILAILEFSLNIAYQIPVPYLHVLLYRSGIYAGTWWVPGMYVKTNPTGIPVNTPKNQTNKKTRIDSVVGHKIIHQYYSLQFSVSVASCTHLVHRQHLTADESASRWRATALRPRCSLQLLFESHVMT